MRWGIARVTVGDAATPTSLPQTTFRRMYFFESKDAQALRWDR